MVARAWPCVTRYKRGLILTSLLFALIGAMLGIRGVSADDWQPISPDELKMTSVPEAPGALAVILYRQVDRDARPRCR